MAEGELLPDPGEPGDLGDGERFPASDEALQSPLAPGAAAPSVLLPRAQQRVFGTHRPGHPITTGPSTRRRRETGTTARRSSMVSRIVR